MKPTADERILSALKRIERAQVELDQACSDLSPVLGWATEWERGGKVSDTVKALWKRVHERFQKQRGSWTLDGNP